MNKKFQPIFIIGVGRSGTSLLQGMLNAHSKIAFTPETHFIRNYLVGNSQWNNAKNEVLQDGYLKNLNLNLEEITNSAASLKEFYILLMENYLKKKDKLFIGDKDPKNIEYLKTIKKNFPDAIIIHIYRDPRAVIASRLKAAWSKENPLWQHILAYKAQVNYFQNNMFLFDNNVLEIQYETLLHQPQEELSKILSVLNLSFEDKMLNFYNSANEIVKGKENSWKENLYKPIMTDNIEKWRKELNPNTIEKIEKALYPEMLKAEYKTKYNSQFYSNFYSFLSFLYCKKYCR